MKAKKGHLETRRVEQNLVETCDDPNILFYTDGLGPCIGVCIAWNGWAGILHSADILSDETDVVASLIEQAKKIIPAGVVPEIQPIVCGGDDNDKSGFCDTQAEEDELNLNTRKCRTKILEIMKAAGFGKPRVLWSDHGQTAALFADLLNEEVYVEHDGVEVGRWRIPKNTTPRIVVQE